MARVSSRTGLLALGMALVVARAARADQVVQVPGEGVLDGRSVSTLTGGAVVPWTTGIDKDDAYMTLAAAKSLGQTGPALPDDGRFAANADHPEVVLHVSNAATATSPQTHLQTAMGAFTIPVPRATYSKVFLFLTASYGDAPLAIKMTYADGTSTMTTFTLPDWGTGKALPAGPPTFFNLIGGLHKWTKAGASLDTPSHTITGMSLTPASDRALASIAIDKTTAAPWLTFWGATGIATSAVGGEDAGADAAADLVPDRGVDVQEPPEPALEPASEAAPELAPEATPEPAVEASDAAVTSAGGAGGGPDAGPGHARSSGGCSIAEQGSRAPAALLVAALAALQCRRRRGV
jgi:hypothetical protein